MGIMNDIEQKAWDKYKEECEEWEIVSTLVRRFSKHREDIEFSMPSLWRWHYAISDRVIKTNRKIRKVREEILTINGGNVEVYPYRDIPQQQTEEEATLESIKELEEEIEKFCITKSDSEYKMKMNFDKLRTMIRSRLAMQDEIGVTRSRLEKVRAELSQVNEEILSLR